MFAYQLQQELHNEYYYNDNDCCAKQEKSDHIDERQLPPGHIHRGRTQRIFAVPDDVLDPISSCVNSIHWSIKESSR